MVSVRKQEARVKNKDKAIRYQPEQYVFSILKVFIPPCNAEKFILGDEATPGIEYKVTLVEFNKEFNVKSLDNIESVVHEEIKKLLDMYYKDNDVESIKKVPIPILFNNNFSGKLMVRVSPELHRQLFIESKTIDLSLNKLIEKKLSK